MQTYETAKQFAQEYADKTKQATVVFLSVDKVWSWTTQEIVANSQEWFENVSLRHEVVEPRKLQWWIVVLTSEDIYVILKDVVTLQAHTIQDAYAQALKKHKYADVWTAFGPFEERPHEC